MKPPAPVTSTFFILYHALLSIVFGFLFYYFSVSYTSALKQICDSIQHGIFPKCVNYVMNKHNPICFFDYHSDLMTIYYVTEILKLYTCRPGIHPGGNFQRGLLQVAYIKSKGKCLTSSRKFSSLKFLSVLHTSFSYLDYTYPAERSRARGAL